VSVLVLDASPEIRTRLAAMLGEAGTMEVHEAADTATMFRTLESTAIDVVVMDVHLPNEVGLNVLRTVRGRCPRIISIVLTNEASEHHRRECMSHGADYFFDKSRHFERAVNVVKSVAGLRSRRLTRPS